MKEKENERIKGKSLRLMWFKEINELGREASFKKIYLFSVRYVKLETI